MIMRINFLRLYQDLFQTRYILIVYIIVVVLEDLQLLGRSFPMLKPYHLKILQIHKLKYFQYILGEQFRHQCLLSLF